MQELPVKDDRSKTLEPFSNYSDISINVVLSTPVSAPVIGRGNFKFQMGQLCKWNNLLWLTEKNNNEYVNWFGEQRSLMFYQTLPWYNSLPRPQRSSRTSSLYESPLKAGPALIIPWVSRDQYWFPMKADKPSCESSDQLGSKQTRGRTMESKIDAVQSTEVILGLLLRVGSKCSAEPIYYSNFR